MTAQIAKCAGFGAIVLAATAAAAAPSDRAEREFTAVWIVQESEAPLGPRSVNDGDFVFRNRLLPPALIQLRANAVDAESGNVVAAADTQLFGLLTQGAPIYCVVGRREPSTAMRILWGGGNRQICLTDLDRDGTLDAHFTVGNQVMGVPNFSGRRPRNPDRLRGVGFDVLPPEQIGVEYFVGVKYEGNIGLIRRNPTPVFSVMFGTERSQERLSGDVRPVRRSDPPLVTPLLAEFVVTGMRDDAIDVDVRRNIPAQPFGVVRTTTYRFY